MSIDDSEWTSQQRMAQVAAILTRGVLRLKQAVRRVPSASDEEVPRTPEDSLESGADPIETFEKHKVSFVSVTQQFNTANSMGRLVLLMNPGTNVPGWPVPSSSGRSSANASATRSPPPSGRVSGRTGSRSSATTWSGPAPARD